MTRVAYRHTERPPWRARAATWGALALIAALLWLSGCTLFARVAPTAAPGGFETGFIAGATATPPVDDGADTASARSVAATPKPRTATATATAQARLPPGLRLATPLPNDRMPTIQYVRLPVEAQATLRLIGRGGPFPYRQDGVVFQNRERRLPAKASGYYREYTVETPGSPDRGARRIIAGSQGELYYTDDHYASFRRVVL